jgi:hypothetical protein
VALADVPNASMRGSAATSPANAIATPNPAASHMPSTPSAIAARWSPAPTRRATPAVVP